MKKHIFGFTLFIFIFASFALAYTFFTAPAIPSKDAVKPPVSQTETRVEKPYSCHFKQKKLSYEVLSSQLDADKNQLTSKVRVIWTASGEPPKEIFVRTELFTLDQSETSISFEPLAFTKVFENRNEATLVILSDLKKANGKIDGRENLYVNFELSENNPAENFSKPSRDLARAYQVLFIHDKISMDKNSIPRTIKK